MSQVNGVYGNIDALTWTISSTVQEGEFSFTIPLSTGTFKIKQQWNMLKSKESEILGNVEFKKIPTTQIK